MAGARWDFLDGSGLLAPAKSGGKFKK
jgi:hypothetical protein